MAPVQIRCVRYTNKRFSPAFDVIGVGIAFLGTLCQFYSTVTVYEFDTFYPDYLNMKSEEDWVLYAETTRKIIASVLNCKLSDLGIRDGIIFEKELKELMKQLKDLGIRDGISFQKQMKDITQQAKKNE